MTSRLRRWGAEDEQKAILLHESLQQMAVNREAPEFVGIEDKGVASGLDAFRVVADDVADVHAKSVGEAFDGQLGGLHRGGTQFELAVGGDLERTFDADRDSHNLFHLVGALYLVGVGRDGEVLNTFALKFGAHELAEGVVGQGDLAGVEKYDA